MGEGNFFKKLSSVYFHKTCDSGQELFSFSLPCDVLCNQIQLEQGLQAVFKTVLIRPTLYWTIFEESSSEEVSPESPCKTVVPVTLHNADVVTKIFL